MLGCRFARWLICENIDVPDNGMQQFRSISWVICIFIRLHMLSACRYNWLCLCCSTPPEYPLEKNFQAASERKNASLQVDMTLWRVQIHAYRVQRAGAATKVSFASQHNHSTYSTDLIVTVEEIDREMRPIVTSANSDAYMVHCLSNGLHKIHAAMFSVDALWNFPDLWCSQAIAGAVFFPHTHGSWLIARQINLF